MKMVKGYKVFNPDWTCRDKQYTCPGKFEEDGDLNVCGHGMHFCKKAADCFAYYNFDPANKVAEVIAYGKVLEDENKCCTDKIEIVREIPWEEVLEIVNTGSHCTGYRNSGDHNAGDQNSGYWNCGNNNTGGQNKGDFNSGNCNRGDSNSGAYNNGFGNTGCCNIGNCNSGNYNEGVYNSGDYNKTNFSSGCFNTIQQKVYFFNKPSNWTLDDWLWSEARCVMHEIHIEPFRWVSLEDMTDQEKEDHPDAIITNGYLKHQDRTEQARAWWLQLPKEKRSVVMSLPNFDKAIFMEITGIDVDECYEEEME